MPASALGERRLAALSFDDIARPENVLSFLSAIPADTIRAYRETLYHVYTTPPIVLRIDEFNAPLAALHKQSGVASSAFVTACNPLGEQASDASSNVRRQHALALDLTQRGLLFYDGIGQHPANDWPGEPSFLVLGPTLEAAKALGQRYAQNAILWSGADAVAQLVLLR